MQRTILIAVFIVFALLILVIVIELLYIKFSGVYVPAPTIPRSSSTQGVGKELSYVVMGDSTSISQGSSYEEGYAVASVTHLAQTYRVTLVNTGISGATTGSVLGEQLKEAVRYKPDLVLLAVGANDTTSFTSGRSIEDSAQQIINALKTANKDVKIVVTRSPAMDSVSRFPFISKWLMALRTQQVNEAFARVIEKNKLTLAPIAEKTRQAFLDDQTLTASDNFHPNARGYALWIPVINDAVDRALAK